MRSNSWSEMMEARSYCGWLPAQVLSDDEVHGTDVEEICEALVLVTVTHVQPPQDQDDHLLVNGRSLAQPCFPVGVGGRRHEVGDLDVTNEGSVRVRCHVQGTPGLQPGVQGVTFGLCESDQAGLSVQEVLGRQLERHDGFQALTDECGEAAAVLQQGDIQAGFTDRVDDVVTQQHRGVIPLVGGEEFGGQGQKLFGAFDRFKVFWQVQHLGVGLLVTAFDGVTDLKQGFLDVVRDGRVSHGGSGLLLAVGEFPDDLPESGAEVGALLGEFAGLTKRVIRTSSGNGGHICDDSPA
ncbi:hypothetical protein [Deinococcus wulumuqiensis]|nr:hypothetical protein [Deinococcus wulumuqiensis]